MLTKIKNFVHNHKKSILAAASFVAAGYYIYRYFDNDAAVKLSSFIEAVESNQVDEVIIEGNNILFSSRNSEWF